MSIEWYDKNAREWHERTKDIDTSSLYEGFLKELPNNLHLTKEHVPLILDAGCGGGRYAKIFLEKGYRVEAFDASSEMAKLATEYCGQEVCQMTFQEMDYENRFDGIWANASLLHVPKSEMRDVFKKFIRALKPGGVWYLSFKHGSEETFERGRLFNNYDEKSLKELIRSFPELQDESVKISTLEDIRPERAGRYWIRAICRRKR